MTATQAERRSCTTKQRSAGIVLALLLLTGCTGDTEPAGGETDAPAVGTPGAAVEATEAPGSPTVTPQQPNAATPSP